MTRKPKVTLPDIEDDDDTFRSKMRPLVDKTVPNNRNSGIPDIRNYAKTDDHKPGLVVAAQQQERIEATRGVKRRFEYVIPERVGRALATDAASRGLSATSRLLEVLRDAGYPVIPEDLIDLRKMPKR